MDERKVLSYNPFEGDFGSPGDRKLKDKLGRARKAGPCHICLSQIQPGDLIRMHSGLYDGRVHSDRWCTKCCEAMASSWDDFGAAMDARFAMRRGQNGTTT